MINYEKEIYLIFLLAVDRSWLSIRQASWTRFTIDHSKIQNECKFFIGDGIFSLLVRNPSAASAITMPANGELLLGRSSVVESHLCHGCLIDNYAKNLSGTTLAYEYVFLYMDMYSISQEICTRFCCTLLCCGYAIVHNEFTWSSYPYSLGLLCWHWGNR